MADAPGRVERVLNLLALLLDTRVPLTRDEIVREIGGYPPQPSANRRAFERDKEVLRGMGVPITTDTLGDAGEVGYRVRAEIPIPSGPASGRNSAATSPAPAPAEPAGPTQPSPAAVVPARPTQEPSP